MLKLLFTVAVVAGVWFLFKDRRGDTPNTFGRTLGRFGRALDAARQAMAASAQDRQTPSEKPASRAETPVPRGQAVELRPCPRCGTYVAVGTACVCTRK
ncbi:MAG: hypothetical protein EPO08_10380 [Rhodospirillaceae bacterium]|nr:MAG: hypothetical protein EPO08_10380 [Rhodospirillaceae bacterium]